MARKPLWGDFLLTAGSQKLQLGDYLAEGVDLSLVKLAGLDVFAEFGPSGWDRGISK